MRRSHAFAVTLVVAALVGVAGLYYWKYHTTATEYAQMKTDDDNTRLRYGEAINDIATIQDSLNAIVLGPDEARMIPTQLQSELRLSANHGDEALARIAVLKAGIERTKGKIEELDATLKRSGVKIAGLQKMIAGLRRNVAEKEQMIAQLNHSVDSLQTTVTGLTADVEDKKRELGTIFYAMGTKKDLTTAGVVVAKGGVLGLGKTLMPSKQASDGAFTALDTDQETVIQTMAPKARVLSAQPPGSYEWRLVDGHMELHITDPLRFRTIKELVIMTT